MKKHIFALLVLTLLLTQACSPTSPTPVPPGSDLPGSDVSQPDVSATPIIEEPNGQPIVMTVLPANSSGGSDTSNPVTQSSDPSQGSDEFFSGDVTMQESGRTINLHTGDSFLLNLGTDQYEWTVSVDNESVLHMKMGVMVIKGAQGIYDALTPGIATLTATGDPLCRQSTPPCAMPSILFTVYVVVK